MKIKMDIGHLVVGIIISLLLNSCITASLIKSAYLICNEGRVKIYKQPENNPTSYVLHYPKRQVVDYILVNGIPIKCYYGSLHKKNEIDTILLCPPYAYCKSYTYRHPGGRYGKYYRYNPIIEVLALSDTTSLIRVTMENPQLYVGVAVAFYPIFVEHVSQNYEPTTPTTIEEYEIIRYVGRGLGEKGMPKVKYPPELTEWEIKANLVTSSRLIHRKKNKQRIQESIENNKKYIDLVLGDDEPTE